MDIHGQTMIYYACSYGGFETLKFLFEKGAWLDIVDSENTTPLWWACFWKQPFEMIKWILEKSNNFGINLRHIKTQKTPYDVATPSTKSALKSYLN